LDKAAESVVEESIDDEILLTFGVYTADKPSDVVKQFRPVLDVLEVSMSERLGQDVVIKIEVAATYEDGIANIVDGSVDFSRFGPASYTEAKGANPDVEVLAIESEKGEKAFYGIIAVHADSDIQSVDDLKGGSFAFGDELSTIGRFLSQLYLYEHGIQADDLGTYEYLGRHDLVGTAVGAGDFDAGALKEGTFKKLVESGVPIRELARFSNVTKPWFARAGLSEEILVGLRESLLSLDVPEALEALGQDGFLAGDDEDYVTIRKAINENRLFFGE